MSEIEKILFFLRDQVKRETFGDTINISHRSAKLLLEHLDNTENKLDYAQTIIKDIHNKVLDKQAIKEVKKNGNYDLKG